MNMPEFTAEASLGPTMGRYRAGAANGKSRIPEFFAIPQFLISPTYSCCGGVHGFNHVYKVCIQCSLFQSCGHDILGGPICLNPVLTE
jgi:hypothetical protein